MFSAHVIPTILPAALLKGSKPFVDTILEDFKKAKRISEEGYNFDEKFLICLPSQAGGLRQQICLAKQWIEHWLSTRCPIAVDIETSALDYFNCRMYSVGICGCDNRNIGIAFPLDDLKLLPWDAFMELKNLLIKILADPNVSKVFHNAPYDCAALNLHGYSIAGQIEDTLVYHHVIQPDIPHSLDWIAQTYLDVGAWKINHKGEKLAFSTDAQELLFYNARDAIVTAALRNKLIDIAYLRGATQELMYWSSEFAKLAYEMEVVGLPINQEKRKAIGIKQLNRLNDLQQKMRDHLNWPDFNPMSRNHAIEALYSKKYTGLVPKVYTEKDKRPSTKYENLLDYLENPFVQLFTSYTEMRNTWGMLYKDKPTKKGDTPGAYKLAIMNDGRLHPHWRSASTKGSRFSSKPNCFDARTEVLTEHGWMPFAEACKTKPKVYQSTITGIVSLTTADFLQREVHKDEHVITYKDNNLDFRVTADHRMLVKENRDSKGIEEKWQVVCADKLATFDNIELPIAGSEWTYGNISIDFAKTQLLAACAHRAIFDANPLTNYTVIILDAYDNNEEVRLLECLLTDPSNSWYFTNSSWHFKNGTNSKNVLSFIIEVGPIKTWLDSMLDNLPSILQWDKTSLENLIEGFHYWAKRSKGTHESYSEWIQIAETLTGLGSKRCRTLNTEAIKKEEILNDSEWFYCATVPKGYIFVRRNRKPLLCGNCQNQRLTDREFIEPVPGRVIVGADKDQLELRLIAVQAGVRDLLVEMNKPDGDPHRMSAIEIYGPDEFFKYNKSGQKALRDGVKTTVYSSIYMGGVETVHKSIRKKKQLSSKLRAMLTLNAVRHIYHSYFGRFVEIPKFHERNYDLVKRQGYLAIPPFNRFRWFPVQPAPFTEVANWPIQTYGSDVVGKEMVEIQYELKRRFVDAYVILHGHDAVYVECYEKDAEAVVQLIDQIFGCTKVEGPAGSVNLTGKAKIGRNLMEVK